MSVKTSAARGSGSRSSAPTLTAKTRSTSALVQSPTFPAAPRAEDAQDREHDVAVYALGIRTEVAGAHDSSEVSIAPRLCDEDPVMRMDHIRCSVLAHIE